MNDVVIVSAFGRGHWIAAELAGHGISVSLVDLSDQLRYWSPEDIEGPFGYFHAANLTLSQKARLDEEDYSELVDDGFVLWLKNGPIDMRGSHSAYLLQKAEIPPEQVDYANTYDSLSQKRRDELLKKWSSEPFHRTWFVNLAHSLASHHSSPNWQAAKFGRPLPIAAPYAVRRVSRRGFEKSLQWIESLGVKVHSKAKIQGLQIQGRAMSALRLEGANADGQVLDGGLLRGEQFVWCLTSSETKVLRAEIFGELFPHGELQPEWFWARYRINLSDTPMTQSLPLKFLVLDDIDLPWSHANLIWLQRTTSPQFFDGWVRLPTVHRFQKSYLEALGREIVGALQNRLTGVDVRVAEHPQEFTYESNELGPALYQLFEPSALQKFRRRRLRNLQFDGPEMWSALDWSGRMESQKEIIEQILDWQKERQLALAKQRARGAIK